MSKETEPRLDGSSNFVIWKAKILAILDIHRIKDIALKNVAIPVDPTANEKYEEAEAKAKCLILDGVKDYVIPHIVEKNTIREMWEVLATLYQGSSVQRKMLLENQLRSYQMQNGEQIDQFLLSWEEMWATLRQEEIRRMTKVGNSGKARRIKKEVEEDAALASMGQQGKRKKKDISKVKCFHCGELGHYAS
eukprot:PITA_03126